MANKSSKKYVDMVEKFFSNLPSLPKGINSVLAQVAPWIVGLVGLLGALNAVRDITGGGVVVISILLLVANVLLLASFLGLLKRKSNSWYMLFYAEIIFTATSVIGMDIAGLIGNFIIFYLIFQIKPFYNK